MMGLQNSATNYMKKYDSILKNVSQVEVLKSLKELKDISLSGADYDTLKKKIKLLVQCGFMAVTFPENKIIYRGREWDPANQTVYKAQSEISYPPVAESSSKLSLNRASSNKFQVFYGAVGTPDFDAAQVIAMTEICKVIEDDFPDDQEEFIVLGQWIVRKEFTVASIALHSEIAKLNRQAGEMLTVHAEICNELKGKGKLIEEVAKFFSNEFSKKVETSNSHEYILSAVYGDLLLELGVPGILFPSVKSDGKAFNVALHKDVVDECLELRVAAISKSFKKGKQIFTGWYLASPEVKEGKIQWIEPPASAQIGSYERRIIERNMAMNSGKYVDDKM